MVLHLESSNIVCLDYTRAVAYPGTFGKIYDQDLTWMMLNNTALHFRKLQHYFLG
jgi:hypothetical protein